MALFNISFLISFFFFDDFVFDVEELRSLVFSVIFVQF